MFISGPWFCILFLSEFPILCVTQCVKLSLWELTIFLRSPDWTGVSLDLGKMISSHSRHGRDCRKICVHGILISAGHSKQNTENIASDLFMYYSTRNFFPFPFLFSICGNDWPSWSCRSDYVSIWKKVWMQKLYPKFVYSVIWSDFLRVPLAQIKW